MSRPIVLAVFLLLAAVLYGYWSQSQLPEPVALTPQISGETEYCQTCHQDLPEISPSHTVEIFGCVRCHGGERLALDADLAHSSLRGGANPSDLAVVEENCGGADCHSGPSALDRDHIQRVKMSLQSTYTGAISSVLYAFGAQTSLEPQFGAITVADQDGHSSTGYTSLTRFHLSPEAPDPVRKFSENCLTCHLSAPPMEGAEYYRLTGCAACHTPTAGVDEQATLHTLTTSISYTQCNTCHNRGNFDLRSMTFNPRPDQPLDRKQDYYQPGTQFTQCEWELDCIDCHTNGEVMGDGDIQAGQASAQVVLCADCHGTLDVPPLTHTITSPDDPALRLAFVHNNGQAASQQIPLQVGDTILQTSSLEPLWNTRQNADGAFSLTGKATGASYSLPLVQGSSCEQNPAEQESRYCHACHAVESEK